MSADTEASIAAAKRVRDSWIAAQALGNPRVILDVADLTVVIEAAAVFAGQDTTGKVAAAGAQMDSMIVDSMGDPELAPAITAAGTAWIEFRDQQAETLVGIPDVIVLQIRGGFMAGFITGWGTREVRGWRP